MTEKKKTLWIPEEWQTWLPEYLEGHRAELKKLGIESVNDLAWRLAELGKDGLEDQIRFYRQVQGQKLRRREKP